MKFWSTKKKETVFQALVQVDIKSYDRLLAAGSVFVGYNFCNVYDGMEIARCFNCNSYGHTSRSCKEKMSCPKCNLEHSIRDCKAEILKCVNYVRQSEKELVALNTNHAVWDYNCPMYKSALQKLKNDIFSE